MYNKIKIINDIVNEYIKKNKITIEDYSINDCLKALNNRKITNLFNKEFENIVEIDETDISFCNEFLIDIIRIYLDNNGIKINENQETLDYNDDKTYSSNLKIYLNDIKKYPLLTKEKERKLLEDYKKTKNKESKDIIINSNQKLILKYAIQKTRDENILLDLIQEGNLALLDTLEKFDLNYNCRFSTYAFWQIRRNIDCAVINSQNIKLPIYLVALKKRINAYCYKIEQKENRILSEEEICKIFNIKLELLRNLRKDYNTTSLNQTFNDETDDEMINFIDSEYDLSLEIERKCIKKTIINELENLLTNDMIDIVMKRYGMYDGDKWTLEAIGNDYNITKQAVDNKLRYAYKRLKKSKILNELLKLD